MKITASYPAMCECGRMYKDRRDANGKMMCSSCYTGISINNLKKIWSVPTNAQIQNYHVPRHRNK